MQLRDNSPFRSGSRTGSRSVEAASARTRQIVATSVSIPVPMLKMPSVHTAARRAPMTSDTWTKSRVRFPNPKSFGAWLR